jgi:putative transposase
MALRRSAHAVYDAHYHLVWCPKYRLVWCPKYRKAVLRGAVAVRLRAPFQEIGFA